MILDVFFQVTISARHKLLNLSQEAINERWWNMLQGEQIPWSQCFLTLKPPFHPTPYPGGTAWGLVFFTESLQNPAVLWLLDAPREGALQREGWDLGITALRWEPEPSPSKVVASAALQDFQGPPRSQGLFLCAGEIDRGSPNTPLCDLREILFEQSVQRVSVGHM